MQDPEPIEKIHSEIKKKHRLFRFSISVHNVLIVLYSIIVISHWLMFVAVYVILGKINVTNKVGQFSTVSPLVLNVSFIYDKTSPGKGGMIGTVYRNSLSSTNNYIYRSRSSPEDPYRPQVQECACPAQTYACLAKYYSK